MDTAIARQFLDFFQDFLNLCQLENWPSSDTTEQEINKAFLMSIHIEKCLEKLKKRNLWNEFLHTLNSQDKSKVFFKNCFENPPKYILTKIVTCKCHISRIDIGIKVFIKLFCEEKLEEYLAQIMVEAASKETLLHHLSTDLPKTKLTEFKSQLILAELNCKDDCKTPVLELLQNCKQETVELLVVSLLNADHKYQKAIKSISDAFKQIMSKREAANKKFWKTFFRLDEKILVKLCLKFEDIFRIVITALLDSGKLSREQMSAEYFYIDLTFSELGLALNKICTNENLKLEFFHVVHTNGSDIEFWESMVV